MLCVSDKWRPSYLLLLLRLCHPLDQLPSTMTLEYTTDATISTSASSYSSVRPSTSSPPVPPAPVAYRRHSLPVPRAQPLRSSPLAGPALSSDLKYDIKKDVGLCNPTLVPPTLSQPSLPTSSKTSKASRHVSFSAIASTSYLATPAPSRYDATIRPLHSTNPHRTHDAGSDLYSRLSAPTIVNRRHPAVTSASTRVPHYHPFPRSPPTDSSEHWMTFNTYDATPRFSRLGLIDPKVVLPVSARQYQRATTKKFSSPANGSRTRTTSSPTSSDNSIRAALSSAESSMETLALSSLPTSVAPSTANISEMGTIVEVDDGTSSINITLIPPTKGMQLKASRIRISYRSGHTGEEHNLPSDSDSFSSKGEIQADFRRRLQRDCVAESLELSVKRHNGIVNRLVRKLSNVARNRSLSR